MDTTEQPAETSDADQREHQWQWEEEKLAEVSRVEIEQADLDNAPDGADEPIQMVDLPESQRTMQEGAETATASGEQLSSGHQRQQNLQVVNSSSLPLKP